jgi:predicted amidophosphoribosyltransferase
MSTYYDIKRDNDRSNSIVHVSCSVCGKRYPLMDAFSENICNECKKKMKKEDIEVID